MAKRLKNIRQISLSNFYCTRCGSKNFPIFRKVGQEKESGHLKKLYCLKCQKEVNMVEIKEDGKYRLENFWIEYKYGNFDENGNRKEPWKQFCVKKRKK